MTHTFPLNEQFEIAAGSIVGRNHVGPGYLLKGRSNQDSYRVLFEDDLIAGVVCDGCSSQPYSEIGSLLGARMLMNRIRFCVKGDQSVEAILGLLLIALVNDLVSIAEMLKRHAGIDPEDAFLFILLWCGAAQAQPATEWTNHYNNGPGYQGVFGIVQSGDGGFVMSGTHDDATDYAQAYLIKIDANGGEVWSNTYGGADGWDYGNGIAAAGDGGFVFTGITTSTPVASLSNPELWIVKVNSAGTELWQRKYGYAGEDAGIGINPTSDGGFIITGYTHNHTDGNGDSDVWILKVNSDGYYLWDAVYGGVGYDRPGDTLETATGDYLNTGFGNSEGRRTNNNPWYHNWNRPIQRRSGTYDIVVTRRVPNNAAPGSSVDVSTVLTLPGYPGPTDSGVHAYSIEP